MNTTSMDYEKEFSDERFWAKIARYAKKIGGNVAFRAICLWLVIREPNVPYWAKSIAMAALGYLIMPLDVAPDPLPWGLADDSSIVLAAFATVAMHITPEIELKARMMMPEWLRV